MRKIIFTVLVISFGHCFAHKNVTVSENFSNVRVLFTTSFHYEEINKALIIGQYAERLSKKLGYEDSVTIWFKHDYAKSNTDSFTVTHDLKNDPSKSNDIFITLVDTEYVVKDILRLLEYSIQNVTKIDNWDGKSIIKKISDKTSELLNDIVQEKIYRPETIHKLEIPNKAVSYYYKDESFHIYRVENDIEKVLLKVENIFQFSSDNDFATIIFDTNESFYHIDNNRLIKPSNRIKIDNAEGNHIPYIVKSISYNKTSISFFKSKNSNQQRVMIYLQDQEKLVQNLDKIIRENG